MKYDTYEIRTRVSRDTRMSCKDRRGERQRRSWRGSERCIAELQAAMADVALEVEEDVAGEALVFTLHLDKPLSSQVHFSSLFSGAIAFLSSFRIASLKPLSVFGLRRSGLPSQFECRKICRSSVPCAKSEISVDCVVTRCSWTGELIRVVCIYWETCVIRSTAFLYC